MRAASESKASPIGTVDDGSGAGESIASLVRLAEFRAAVFSGLHLQTRLAERAWRLPMIFATGYADEDPQRKGCGRVSVQAIRR